MAEKIYNKQSSSLQVQSPVAMPVDTGLSNMLSDRAVKASKVAGENFVLGQKMVMEGILDYGYTENPESPKEFLATTQEAFEKQVQGMPENMREKMADNFFISQKNYLLSVEDNFIKKQDATLQENSMATVGQLTQSLNIAHQNLNNASVSDRKEEMMIARKSIYDLERQIAQHANITKSDGSFLYGSKARGSLQSGGEYNSQDTFEQSVDGLSGERLYEWDKSTFQNQKKYMNETGIDRDTYNNQSKYIADRLKAMDYEKDRVIKSTADFETANLIPNYNSDEYKKLYKNDATHKPLLEAINSSLSGKKSVNEVQNTYRFMHTLANLAPILASTDESEEGNTKRFNAATKVIKEYKGFAEEQGLSIEEQDEYLSTISRGLADKQFNDVLQPLFADNALRDSFFNAVPKRGFWQVQQVKQESIDFNKLDENAEKNAYDTAELAIKTAISFAGIGEYDKAKRNLEQGNKEVMKARAAPYISRWEMTKLEIKLSNGEKAYFTTKFNNTYEFMGYSNKDAIFKAVR